MRETWGPDWRDAPPVVQVAVPAMPLARFLGHMAAVREAVGPVQALRADRVVSRLQLDMAAWHARRAARDGRARSTDRALEFLLYVAADRQINRALGALGYAAGESRSMLVVGLGDSGVDQLAAAVRDAFGAPVTPWTSDLAGPDASEARVTHDTKDAAAWWRDRLGLVNRGSVEDAVLAEMATLAVARL